METLRKPNQRLHKGDRGAMPGAMSPLQRPAVALPPRPHTRWWGLRLHAWPSLWVWPVVLSLAMVAGVMTWMHAQDVADREAARSDMISDALSLESQISIRLEAELSKLRELADDLGKGRVDADDFDSHPLVLDGLRRFWVSVTWLGPNGRILALAPSDAVPPNDLRRLVPDEAGLAGHLSVPWGARPGAEAPQGLLVARYGANVLLRQKVPWWLASRYDIRLVDQSDVVLASTAEGPRQPWQAWYRVPMGPSMPQAWLELSSRTRVPPWWRSWPVVLMGAFVGLLAVSSLMLRRQMQGVAKAETAWRTEAAWRTAIEDSLAVGIRARDLDGRLVYVNKTMADMVGYTTDELVGKLPPMPYWAPDEIEQTMQRHLRNMAGLAPREGYESRWRHRDGTPVDVMVFEAPFVDAKGIQIGWMASVLNITERKRMEERERKQTETMAHHARLTMLGEVASTLAHELNQPLSAIASYNAGLQNALGAREDVPERVRSALQRQGEQAAQAGRIVRRIREFLTRREPQREPEQVGGIIHSGVNLLRKDLARGQVALEMAIDGGLPDVDADPILIEQVVVNLVRNACDALQAGPVAEGRRIQVKAQAVGTGFVMVSVHDNGPGLNGQGVETLCAPFHTTKPEGMGMGLAICRSIVELHYGAMDAGPSPLGGAFFSFTLPITRPDAQEDNT
jgi:two-component system sensor histidine kinase DctS